MLLWGLSIFQSVFALLSGDSQATEAASNILVGLCFLLTVFMSFNMFMYVPSRICAGEFWEDGHPTVYLYKVGKLFKFYVLASLVVFVPLLSIIAKHYIFNAPKKLPV